MSAKKIERSKYRRRLCAQMCGRKARFRRYGGRVKADKDHRLCFACFRSARDSELARRRREPLAALRPQAMPGASKRRYGQARQPDGPL